MLLLGLMILLPFVALRQLRGDGERPASADVSLVQRGGEWRYARPAGALVLVTVEHVIDGDTLDVRSFDGGALRVRVFGVNAPETGERCADEATALPQSLAGEAVRVLPDLRLEDSGGRQLRYLFTPDGVSIDSALIVAGVALAWDLDGALRDRLVALERDARAERRGCLWSDG
jgi:endonuclease YncB( thermonuclease family)